LHCPLNSLGIGGDSGDIATAPAGFGRSAAFRDRKSRAEIAAANFGIDKILAISEWKVRGGSPQRMLM
jgi:hypothetical protein